VGVATPGKRSFWLHQLAEYLIGAVFIAQGLQSTTPLVPSVLGGLVMLNAACAKGPLSAFRIFGRRMHRILDALIIALIIFASLQPWVSIDSSTRLVMGLLGFVLGFVWVQSDFAEKVKREHAKTAVAPVHPPTAEVAPPSPKPPRGPDGSTSDAIGRAAGRLAGKGVNAYRARRDQLKR